MAKSGVEASVREKPLPEIRISCDRASHRYHVGEKAVFLVDSDIKKLPVKIVLSLCGEKILSTCEKKLPAKVEYALSEPGFIRCSVYWTKDESVVKHAGAGFDPDELKPVIPEPADFDQFWRNALKEQERIPADMKVTEKKPGFFSLSCATVNHVRQYGFLYIPPKSAAGSCPLEVCFGGGEANISFQQFKQTVAYANRSRKTKIAIVWIHLPPYEPVDFNFQLQKRHARFLKDIGGLRRYLLINLDKSPKDLYFYPAILGGLRLIDYAATQPEIDPERIAYQGASHGGAFGIYYTALSPHIKAAFCGVPNFGDIGGVSIGRHTADVPEYKPYWEKLLYFDTAYFAKRIQKPIMISAGFADLYCTPGAVYCIRNALRGPVLMFDKVNHGHGDCSPEYSPIVSAWIDATLNGHVSV